MRTDERKGRAITVLIADDEPCTRQIISVYLEDAGYQLVVAEDGDEALRLAKRVLPDLILLDYNLPPRNGLEVAREIKRGLRTRRIPIALVTASENVIASRRDGSGAAWAARLKKPFDQDKLVGLVESLTAPPESDEGTAHPGATKRKRALPESVKRNFLERLGTKVSEMNTLLDSDSAACTRDVLTALHGHLHQVHGAAGLCGFAELGAAAADAERLVRGWLDGGATSAPLELDRIRVVVEQFATAVTPLRQDPDDPSP